MLHLTTKGQNKMTERQILMLHGLLEAYAKERREAYKYIDKAKETARRVTEGLDITIEVADIE